MKVNYQKHHMPEQCDLATWCSWKVKAYSTDSNTWPMLFDSAYRVTALWRNWMSPAAH
jgi:hypothetical protein